MHAADADADYNYDDDDELIRGIKIELIDVRFFFQNNYGSINNDKNP